MITPNPFLNALDELSRDWVETCLDASWLFDPWLEPPPLLRDPVDALLDLLPLLAPLFPPLVCTTLISSSESDPPPMDDSLPLELPSELLLSDSSSAVDDVLVLDTPPALNR